MKSSIKLLVVITILACGNHAWSAGTGAQGVFEKIHVDLSDKTSLQRGAKYFVNYCLSCHPSKHSRYKRVADDLGISETLAKENLIFTDQKFGDLMTVAMKREDATKWFLGIDPPDLSTHARAIGPQAVYEYLKSFYVDDTRPFGVNNLHLPNTAMPHVLINLQGLQKAIFHDEVGKNGKEHPVFDRFEISQPGSLSEEEYERVVVDIVNFLAYLSEPAQLVRKKIGIGVLFFLAVLGVLSYFMKKSYWKDIH